MGLFKNIVNFFKSEKNKLVSFKLDQNKFSIDSNFLYPFLESEVNISNNKDIKLLQNEYIFFNSLDLKVKNNYINEFYEINNNKLEFYYPKNQKLKNFIKNYFYLIEGNDYNLLKFDISEDYKCYSNIYFLIKKYNLIEKLNLLNILNQIKWILDTKHFEPGNIEILIKGPYYNKYIYEIISISNSIIIGKNENEYILINLVDNDIKIGRKI